MFIFALVLVPILFLRAVALERRAPACIADDDASTNSISDDTVAAIQQDLVSLAGQPYTLVIDTGSSDTWVASSSFDCISQFTNRVLPQQRCGFGALYDRDASSTFASIPTHDFGVKYTDGEFLTGEMGTEELGIGGAGDDALSVLQTIGMVERGWWMVDGMSSGLMGLAYPTLASNVGDLNYTSVVFSIFEDSSVPSIFRLALSRPTQEQPVEGGLLAIGGVPDVAHDGDFESVPIHPMLSHTYAFYSVPVEGFDISPPPDGPSHRTTGSAPSSFFRRAPLDMIIDSGSTLLSLPYAVADHIASLFIPGAAYSDVSNPYLVPYSAAPPRVGVEIAGKTFFIHPDDLMNKSPGAVGGGRGMRTLAVQRQGGGDAVLGDSWLKGMLAVFDVGGNEMKFAEREEY